MRGVAFTVLVLLYCDVSGLRIRIRRKCSYDAECEPNSYCQLQTQCECKSGFYQYTDPNTTNEFCVKGPLEIGDECDVDYQCQIKMGLAAECSNVRVCQCRQGAHYISASGRCYNTSKINEPCLTSDYCHIEQPGVLLTCDRGRCVCPRGHHGSRDGSRCIASVRLGDSCTTTEQCITTNTICYEECRCDVHHIENANRTRCLREAEQVGDTCEESPQCSKTLENSGCVQGKCQCLELYHPGTQGHKCWKTNRVGEPCEDDNECIPTPVWDPTTNLALAKCIMGRCTCAVDTIVDSNGSCIENAAVYLPASSLAFLSAIILPTVYEKFC
ncbi:prion-like-(Q/N-rich) domain-bearing protein 25 [Anabrus simplex]|uniref:prion-like-(Q/N-rich) domain-bearing protein 25 n=1 Tax=Anabrus simplex TaxID=316456 RepID=UPI0034DCF42C